MKKLRRYQKRKLLKSIEITSLAGIAGLCGYLILSQEHSKEISQNSNNSAQVKMKEDNAIDNTTEEMITRNNMIISTVRNNKIDENFGDVVAFGTPFVVKVEPVDYTYGELYKTIDYIKSLMSQYTINAPILFDIEPLMQNDTLRANCLLAEEFFNKLTANGCYVGLYGSDESMIKFEEKFKEVTESHSIDLYDKLIVYDGEQPTYDGTYNMSMKQGTDKIESKYDISKAITEAQLNMVDHFIEDKTYTIQPGDKLVNIANKFNMKVSDLANYNNIEDINKIIVGQTITLPNQYQDQDNLTMDTAQTQENIESETANRLVKGIDVSHHQGIIDWETVQQEIDYAIVRLCDFYHQQPDGTCKLDKQFENNIKKCEELNIPVGVYYYSHATTEEEAVTEARFVADSLKAYSLEYPVYMDIETEEQNAMIDENQQQMKEVIISAMTELESEGYFAGVYCNGGSEDNTKRKEFIADISKVYNCWLTSNATYNIAVDFEDFKAEDYEILTIPNDEIAMFQYSQQGQIDGISGNVDLNYATKELSDTIIEKGFSKIKQ